MVFTRLTPADKDAFFALLDEYFASRPDLFGNGASGAAGKAAAASVVQSVLSSPPAVPATNGWRRPDSAATAEISSSVGRVAAAAAALRASNGGADPTPGQNGSPRPPPRRNTSSSEEPATPAQPEHARLVPQRRFGDVDMSSGKNMLSSIRNSTAAKHATPAQIAPPTPPAFQRKNDFAPPPRRVPSTSASTPSPAASPAPPAPPALPRRNTQQEEGEWAEALYDYHSEDPGDLDLQEGVRVLVLERTSDDWWTGEIDGQRGLIPAAYVKVL
ncbi:SH3 domain-containing protein [Cerioporus squamosus]|nr:SH3 domain-containing protein [Cerioporus squamosus]